MLLRLICTIYIFKIIVYIIYNTNKRNKSDEPWSSMFQLGLSWRRVGTRNQDFSDLRSASDLRNAAKVTERCRCSRGFMSQSHKKESPERT